MRLDQYLVLHHGLTRNKAQQLIATDLVCVNAKICNKASFQIGDSSIVTITADRRVEWVSRSAEKLAEFIERLDMVSDVSVPQGYTFQYHSSEYSGEIQSKKLTIAGTNCLDVGSSTGGFTQVLLQYGATHIDAVDVGTDQLHPSLRSDSRVSSYEQTDIRDFATEKQSHYDIIVCDASFISLSMIIDAMLTLSNIDTRMILLYKPQFEVGREHLRKTGVPKDIKIVEANMTEFENLLTTKNTNILKKEKSSLIGEAGNQEWIYMIQKNPQTI